MSGPLVSPGKVLVYTFTPERGHAPAVCMNMEELLQSVKDHLENSEVGDELFLKVHEMTHKEIEDLPEHPGW